MRIAILFLITGMLAIQARGQSLIPLQFSPEEDNVVISENDSEKFYQGLHDTTQIVCINEEASTYKLLNRARKIIAEGSFVAEGDKYLQDGKWTQRFDNGKVRVAGYYLRNKPVGAWQEYYSSGKSKLVYDYAIISDNGVINSCLSGSFQEYYADGKLKVSGFYKCTLYTVKDTVIIEDPINDAKISKVITSTEYKPEKVGRWEYYTETGEVDKKEDF
jgi:MORN repeat protein